MNLKSNKGKVALVVTDNLMARLGSINKSITHIEYLIDIMDLPLGKNSEINYKINYLI